MKSYPHNRAPWAHQDENQREHAMDEYWGLFWEQGTGKTKGALDSAYTQWRAGKIDALLVGAPAGVHESWILDELEEHTPPEWRDEVLGVYYESGKAGTKRHQKKMLEALETDKFLVLAMSHDAFRTKPNKTSGWMGGRKFAEKMLRCRRAMFVLDESSVVQTPSTQITKTLVGFGRRGGLAKLAASRRILEGTPADEGPFNVYGQMQFLDQNFWVPHGFSSSSSFKTYFGIFQERERSDGRRWQECVGYRNLDELREILKTASSRILKKDVLNLPEKVYQQARFDMSPAQWKDYNTLKEELHLFLDRGNATAEELLTAELPIVNVLRLYQISCGYIPTPDGESPHYTYKENPRLEVATQRLRANSGQVLVWCRFNRDIDLLCDQLGAEAVRYDGGLDPDQRRRNKASWLAGGHKFLVAQIASMYRGHTLNIAEDVLYYSNDARLRRRRQSEDRTHRGTMRHTCIYTDIMATGTVDETRVKSLKKKLKTAQEIMGDET